MQPTREELRNRYAAYSVKRLLTIVHRKYEYTDEAVDIARAELATRDISVRDVDLFLDEVDAQSRTQSAGAYIPMTLGEKAILFFAWVLFIASGFQRSYLKEGLLLKYEQSQSFALAGFISMIIDGIIITLLKLGPVHFVLVLAALFFCFLWIERQIKYELSEQN